jgi:hypothetical protein
MHAPAWTHPHLPHLQRGGQHPIVAAHHRFWTTRRTIVVTAVTLYVIVLLALNAIAHAVFGMGDAVAWGFSVGVTSYILLFTSFISALIWMTATNALDHPSRR